MSASPNPHRGASPERTQPASHGGLAITSMILGILWCAGVGSVLAVIFAFVDFSNARLHGRRNSGFAIAGLVLGIIGSVTGLIFWILIGIGIHDANQLSNYSNSSGASSGSVSSGSVSSGSGSGSGSGSAPPASTSTWTTDCVVVSSDQFELYATNNSGQGQNPPGWTVDLYANGTYVGSSDQDSSGNAVLGAGTAITNPANAYAGPGQTIHSNTWTIAGVEFNSCTAIHYDEGG